MWTPAETTGTSQSAFYEDPTARLHYVKQGHFEAHLNQFCKTAWDTNKRCTEAEI